MIMKTYKGQGTEYVSDFYNYQTTQKLQYQNKKNKKGRSK